MTQALMELEVAQHLGAERYQRSPERQGERNGYRDRNWDTRVGTLELRVPRVRDGSFFPGLLEPRKRAERALVATIREAYVQGVSTRRVDDLVKALGLDGISKSQVSRLCEELDAEVERFRTRKLEGTYPYMWVDATFLKVRQEHRVVNMAVVIAVGLHAATGQREVLGVDVGPSEDGTFWLRFLRGLVARGLAGVQLITSDSHQGLKGAIAAVLQGASWQRCRDALYAERALSGAKGHAADGRRHHPHRLRPAGCGQCPRAMAPGRRPVASPLPTRGPAAGRSRGGGAGLPGLSPGALAPDLVQQSARAAQQGGQAPHRCGGH